MNTSNIHQKFEFRSHDHIRTVVVDDSPCLRAYLAMLVEAEGGFEMVGEAADGRSAVRSAAALRPDLILMDVDMPVMDGITATHIIKEIGARIGYAPAIVIVTGGDSPECRTKAIEAGADAFVAKSENLSEDLKVALHRLLNENAHPATAGANPRTELLQERNL